MLHQLIVLPSSGTVVWGINGPPKSTPQPKLSVVVCNVEDCDAAMYLKYTYMIKRMYTHARAYNLHDRQA